MVSNVATVGFAHEAPPISAVNFKTCPPSVPWEVRLPRLKGGGGCQLFRQNPALLTRYALESLGQ